MTYLVILFVLALALAPIFALMPSKRQKLQMELRDKARVCGLQVQICDLPQTRRDRVREEDVVKGVAYRLLWQLKDFNQQELKQRRFSYIRLRDVPHEEHDGEVVPEVLWNLLGELLQALPESIQAVECAEFGLSVYWLEKGDVQTVADIKGQLEAIKSRFLEVILA